MIKLVKYTKHMLMTINEQINKFVFLFCNDSNNNNNWKNTKCINHFMLDWTKINKSRIFINILHLMKPLS